MSENIDDSVLERLEAEALTADAEAEELTIAVESDIEQTEVEVEELQTEVDEKEEKIEELQSEVEETEAEVEELRENMDSVKETYAEELARDSDVLDTEDFLDRFEFEELQEKYEALDTSSPAPNSGDPGAGFQSPTDGGSDDGDGGEPEELSEKARIAADQFNKRGGVWAELGEDIEQNGLGEVRRADDVDNSVFE